MTGLPEQQLEGSRGVDGLLLEFDYFKHLSTIALVALGGALTLLTQPEMPKDKTAIALVLFGFSAAHCFSAMGRIVAHRRFGKPLQRWERYNRWIATTFFTLGLGILAGIVLFRNL